MFLTSAPDHLVGRAEVIRPTGVFDVTILGRKVCTVASPTSQAMAPATSPAPSVQIRSRSAAVRDPGRPDEPAVSACSIDFFLIVYVAMTLSGGTLPPGARGLGLPRAQPLSVPTGGPQANRRALDPGQ